MMHSKQKNHFLPLLIVQNTHSVFDSVQMNGQNV